MFDTSQDILFWVIAIAVAVLTFFLSWLLFYMVRIIRRGYDTVNLISEKIETLSAMIDSLREKLEHSAGAFTALSKAMIKLVGYWQEKKSTKKGKKGKNDDKEDF